MGLAEQALPFRFPVTWLSVFDPLETVVSPAVGVSLDSDWPRGVVAVPAKPCPALPETLSENPAKEPVFTGTKRFGSDSRVQWEMVVPKMVRTTPKAATHEAALRNPRVTSSIPTRQSASYQPVPNFYTESAGFLSGFHPRSLTILLLLAATAAIAIAGALWIQFGSTQAARTEIETTTRVGGWAREPVTRIEAGFNRSRRLVVFRPSLKASDCRFEFDWKPDTQAIGWVFRATDTSNYYAMRIKLLKQGSTPTFSLEHFAVYRGVESSRSEKVLVLSREDPVLRIRTEMAGPTFTVYLGGRAVEYWTDTRLPSGGLGFLEEWNQRVDVQSVRMSFAPGTEIQRDALRLYMNIFMNAGRV